MQEDDNLMKHINTIKALTNQLVCLRVPMTNEDIVIILLESLPTSYEYLIMKELTIDYMTIRLMHEILKHKEKEPEARMPP